MILKGEQMNSKGVLTFNLGGVDFDFVPTFENLDRLESVTNKPIYGIANQPKLSDAIKCFLACAKPQFGKNPEWFNANGLFERIVAENKTVDLCLFLVQFCSSVLSAGSETDIKTVGAEDDDVKK